MQFAFADHVLDTGRRELRRGPELIEVEPQVFDLLAYLVQNTDRVISKDDLIASIWDGRIVSDSTLSSRIYAARRAVGDSGQHQKLIRTIARKGLRFVGSVHRHPNAEQSVTMADPATDDSTTTARPPLPTPDRAAIAVLPFTNMSGDPEQEYFSDGISEDIIAALSKLRWFFVIARASSFAYKNRAVHIKDVAEELGVSYVLEGSVRRSGGRVRITAQLNDVIHGSHLWAERYDRNAADVFAVQDEITESIVAAIEPQLFVAENFRARRKLPSSMDAWELVMRALSHYWRVTKEDHVAARALLEQAISIDPRYGHALGVLGASYTFAAHMGWEDGAVVVPIAERAALAAIRADDEDPWAHHALGAVYLLSRRFDEALAEFDLALRFNPNFSQAQNHRAAALAFCGRWEESIRTIEPALRLSPRDPFSALYFATACFAHYIGGNYDEALRLARTAVRLRGDFASAHRVLAAATGMVGPPEAAAAALEELRRAQPNISLAWIEKYVPLKRDCDRERYLEGFRRAGLS